MLPVPLTVPGVIDEFIQAKHVWPRSVESIRHFGLHTPQGPETPRFARALGNYFATTDRVASTHFGCDSELTARYARDDQTCAAAKGINTSGIHIEIAGVAEQTEAEWLDPFSRAALARAANVFKLYGPGTDSNIPARILTPEELARGVAGIVKHSTAWQVFGGDFRSDPGANFPDELFLALCRGEEEDDDDMSLTVTNLRTGETGYRAGEEWAVRFVQQVLSLPAVGTYNGPKNGKPSAILDKAVADAKGVLLGKPDASPTMGADLWRAIVAAGAQLPLEPAIVEVPDKQAAEKIKTLEASLAECRGLVAGQRRAIDKAGQALAEAP